MLDIKLKHSPELHPNFTPAAVWNRAFKQLTDAAEKTERLTLIIAQPNGVSTAFETTLLSHEGDHQALNIKHIERAVKTLLWQHGGNKITFNGNKTLLKTLAAIYSSDGARAFDNEFLGKKIYGGPIEFVHDETATAANISTNSIALGRNLQGCRIGFDLGGSDRKCAAVIDGEVVYSEEVEWSPYFESDPDYHIAGIQDSLKKAAAHLPRVDAIGGSAAGVYIDNEVKAGSLYRGIPDNLFQSRVQTMFLTLKREWGNIPFEVVNDGEVTALAGAMSLGRNKVLGLSMGTSQAAGYVNANGAITSWLNELAFAPVDYAEDAPVDEWSGDSGCGVQYFSQQAVARLAKVAGFEFEESMPLPARLVAVQDAMQAGDARAEKIYATIGIYLGYTLAHYKSFYDFNTLLLLGRVTSGSGCDIMIDKANQVLADEFPEYADSIEIVTPDEKNKRHGQAIAAASLPK